MTRMAPLSARTVIEVSGEDRVAFLQGLVSNDVNDAAPGRAVWAALLTPQGKYLADFFILSDDARLLLDAEATQAGMLIQRLSRYRLRSRVAIAAAPLLVYAAWDGAPEAAGAIMAPDPRLEGAGWRVLAPEAVAANATEDEYDLHRLALGLPD
ncbi:MAG: folate-binding protein, partial [Acetobacteraceae bacterium]